MAFFVTRLYYQEIMGTIQHNSLASEPALTEAVTNFFSAHTPDTAKVLTWKIFQCWTLKDCEITSEIPKEKIALFLDQLNDLVAAAYILHQANRASSAGQQGDKQK